MQNVSQGTVSDSDKDTSSQNSDSNLGLGTPDKCQTYADLQDKFCTSSGDSDSDEEDISEVESFVLGEGEEEEVVGVEEILTSENPSGNSNSLAISNNSKFLLATAHSSTGASVSDYCVGDCGGGAGTQSLHHHHHHHTQPQFDPDTQARLVALLEAAVSSSSDPEVLRRLTSSVSSALDEAAAALTRMRSDTASGTAAAAAAAAAVAAADVTVGGSSSSNSCSSSSSTSSSGSNSNINSSGSSSSGGSASSSRSSSTPGSGQRTLVEACTDGDVHAVKRLLDEGRSVHETTEEGESLLSLTCSAGYFDLAQVLLAMRANVEDRGMKGDCTPLMEAASAGHVEIVKLLLAHNAEINAQSSSGNTPLMYACGGGHVDVVKVLLEHGANVEDHNENGHTPLMEAASAGHVNVAQLLLEKGAGINTSSNEFKESALTLACYKGHLDMVKFLLDAGADQEHKTDEMHTALMEASMDGHVEVARLLLDSGAQVNMPADSFESPLTLAACGGHTDLALLLLERGANIEEVNDEGYTPLMEAAREGHEEMVTLLLSHDADINSQTEETQETALTLACCGGFKEVAHILIKAGADMELGSSTPLMEAAQEGHRDLVKFLIEMGSNVNAQTSTGDTALTYACENGHTDVAGYLLRANADMEHESEGGRTPLMKACRAGHFCTVQFLIAKGCNINKTTTDNDHTPLSLACVGGHVRIVEFLLASGADPHHKLKDNLTMLMEASKGGHTLVVKLLMDYPNSIAATSVTQPNQPNGTSGEVVASAMVDNCSSTIGIATAQNSQLSMGLTVVPGPDSQQSPVVLTNAPNQILLPDISLNDGSTTTLSVVSDAGKSSQQQQQQQQSLPQKNTRVNKVPRKNIGVGASNYVSDNSASNQLKDDFLLDEDARGTAKLLDVLKREVEQTHNSREEQLLSKQHILEQLHRVEKQMDAIVSSSNTVPAFSSSISSPISSGTIINSLGTNGSLLNAAVGGHVMYPSGTLPALPHSTQTVETQTGFLPTSAWTVLPSGMGISDITSTLKASNQLPPSLYGGSAPQIPLDLPSEGAQIPSSVYPSTSNCPQEATTAPYLSPTSPSSFTNTSPPSANVPVQERRKMIPSKKQLDKKKLQLQQQQQQQKLHQQQQNIHQHQLASQSHQHQCILQQVPMETTYNCIANQAVLVSQANPASPSLLSGSEASQCLPPPISHSPSQGAVGIEKGLSLDIDQGAVSLLLKPKPEPPKNSKKDKKRSITSPHECDCGMHDDRGEIEGSLSEGNDIVPTMASLGTSLHLPSGLGAATGGNLQFVPTSGIVSSQHLHFAPYQVGSSGVPLQYSHLNTLSQAVVSQGVANQSAVAAAVVAQQLQGVSSTGNFTNTSTSNCAVSMSQSQVKQFLLKPPQVGVTTGQRGPGLNQVLPVSTQSIATVQQQQQFYQQQQLQQSHQQQSQTQQQVNLTSQLSNAKKSKKSTQAIVKTDVQHQQQLQDLTKKCLAIGSAAREAFEQKQQPLSHGNSAAVAGLSLDNVSPNMMYPNNIAHFPVTSLPLNESGLMVATPATPAKILNDQMSDMITAQSSQVGNNQLGVPYPGNEGTAGAGGVLYQNSGVGGVCHYPAPLVDVDSETDSNHDTALTLACAGGHEELVQLLLQRGANIEHCDKKGFTPLILAATAGHGKVVETLLNHNANIEAQSERTKDTPLSLACSGGRYEVVEILLARGANKEHRNVSDYTPLSLAASGGYVNIIKLLLDNGAEINSRTGSKLGISPLMLAAMNGHTNAVKLLLDMGSDINAQIETNRNTALTLACFQGRHEVVSLLLDRKANVEHRAKTGLTPLMEAASGGYVDVGKVLIEKGADVNAPPVPSSRDTALTIAADKGHLKFVELLITNGAQTEVKNKKGNSPMWLAANGGHIDVVTSLFEANTDINSEDNRKVSCLMSAFKKGHFKLIKFMVKHVTQFPSDQELERYICTLTDEEHKKKCHNCAEVIRVAKEKQAQEANKNASILLDLLEKEKTREESRKASALRKKQKKKARKLEKKEEKKRLREEDHKKDGSSIEREEDEEEEEEEEEEDEEEKEIEIKTKNKSRVPHNINNNSATTERADVIASEERDGDSGIDSNSQTSASSETKNVEEKASKGKKKKKKKEPVKETKVNNPPVNNNNKQRKISPLQKVEVENSHKNSNNSNNNNNNNNNNNVSSQVQLHHIVSSSSVKTKKKREEESRNTTEINDLNLVYYEMKSVGGKKSYTQDLSSRVNALDTFGEVEYLPIPGGGSSSTYSNATLSPIIKSHITLGTSPKKIGRREEGWKEVSRKAKRVSVPNTAISRVIGRGGCNINTIREVSGAHIEVEKQGKSQGDRMIIIKGSTEATRQAQNLINSLVKDPEKDLSELLPKSVVKVPPKITKISSMSDATNSQSVAKNARMVTTASVLVVTSTTGTSVYSSAKTGVTTVSAWANIASPKRTPINLRSNVSNSHLAASNSKSPAVRQLFPGEKKSLLGSSPVIGKQNSSQSLVCENSQTFASKLAENKSNSKNSHSNVTKMTSHLGSNDVKDVKINDKRSADMKKSNPNPEDSGHQYSIFSNLLGQMPSICGKEKPLNFAKAASEGLGTGRTPLGQQPQIASHGPYLDSIDTKPVVDVSRAPGYRGTVVNSSSVATLTTKTSINIPINSSTPSSMINTSNITIMKSIPNSNTSSSLPSVVGSSITTIPSPVRSNTLSSTSMSAISVSTNACPGGISPLEASTIITSDATAVVHSSVSPCGIPSMTSMARSAPGTPVASPSLRPIAPPNARQFATPPPIPRSMDIGGGAPYGSLVGPSRTPPPSMPSLMRIQVAPPSVASGTNNNNNNAIQSRPHMSPPANLTNSFASGMYITPPPPPPPSSASLASLAPGGPVSSQQRPQHERNDLVNLAVGQPYRKAPMSDMGNMAVIHQQSAQQNQPQQQQTHQQQLHQQQIHPQQHIHQHLQQQVHHQQQQQQMHHQQQQVHQQQQQVHQQQQQQQQVHQQQVHQVHQHQVHHQVHQQQHQMHTQVHTPQVHPQVHPQLQQQQAQQQQQQQHSSHHAAQQHISIAALMNGLRFTTPQTNTQPVFTNNILAPISAAPHIQSNLNPNAPDFSSRAPSFVQGTYTPRTQLAAYQNGISAVPPSIYTGVGIGQFAANIDSTGMQMQPGINDIMSNLLSRSSNMGGIQSPGGNMAFRSVGVSQEVSSPMNSPHSSNPSSPTQSAGGVAAGVVASVGGAAQATGVGPPHYAHHVEDRHAKLQPIGTERAQKRSERVNVVGAVPPPAGLGGVGVVGGVVRNGGDLLWTRSDLIQTAVAPQVEPVLSTNLFYPAELDIASYSAPIWNWGTDTNH